MDSYATLDDVYLLGLSAQAFVVLPRPPDAVGATTATIRLKAHGLSVLDVITFEGTTGGTLPTGISEFTTYYPIPVSADLFRLALTPGGSAISSWVTAGEGWGITIDPSRRLTAHLVETRSEIDEHLTAHEPPIQRDPITGKFPQVLIGMNARMAARAGVISLDIENTAYRIARDRLMEREVQDRELLEAWKAGKPIQPRPTDETPQSAENSALASSAGGDANWRNCGVL